LLLHSDEVGQSRGNAALQKQAFALLKFASHKKKGKTERLTALNAVFGFRMTGRAFVPTRIVHASPLPQQRFNMRDAAPFKAMPPPGIYQSARRQCCPAQPIGRNMPGLPARR